MTAPGDLVAGAHIIVSDEPLDTAALRRANPALVVVTITPFGLDGPWVGRPWTEFTLQAACGSVGQRGFPERPPLAAGGRIGEWVTGTYAALGVLGAWREARRSGQGEDVDVAVLDCMAVTMVTYPSVFASMAGWPPQSGTGRTVQLPSIEPARDGYVVFTANSAQQFQDFLVLIERADLLDDTELAQIAKRFARRDEFLAAVRAHTRTHSRDELLEEAAAFRIPAAPVLDAPEVLAFEHFVERDVFVPAPSGRFAQPTRPLPHRRLRTPALHPGPRHRRRRRRPVLAGALGAGPARRRLRGCPCAAFGWSTSRPGGPDRRPPTSWPPWAPR